ncbi:unnamed protein product [Strongylus vulgaris]|uniref:Uncharacterized protein n=1 Tax=Strongylus vulgaris TaxID=40348 RepID=A0A3P7L2Z1_STRVU|nr:unnamed protein product [Strongylus vulgaris]
MHSKPYPYGEAAYTTVVNHKVPHCIDGYCACSGESSKEFIMMLEQHKTRDQMIAGRCSALRSLTENHLFCFTIDFRWMGRQEQAAAARVCCALGPDLLWESCRVQCFQKEQLHCRPTCLPRK